MKLSCPDYTWPLLSHDAALDLVAALGFDSVDIGFMSNRSHVRPESLEGADVERAGETVRDKAAERRLSVSDVFAIEWTDFETMAVNHPDRRERDRGRRFFAAACRFAARTGTRGITTLPGVVFPGESPDASMTRAAENLRERVDIAEASGLELSVEPHCESLIDTPERAAALLHAVPGLTLTLDHAHFVVGGAVQEEIDELLPSARHLQCRSSTPARLQARVEQDVTDFGKVVDTLLAIGYGGSLAVEFVWAPWRDCNQVDTVGETALMRDRLVRALAGVEEKG